VHLGEGLKHLVHAGVAEPADAAHLPAGHHLKAPQRENTGILGGDLSVFDRKSGVFEGKSVDFDRNLVDFDSILVVFEGKSWFFYRF
jgi:hypothetical protein